MANGRLVAAAIVLGTPLGSALRLVVVFEYADVRSLETQAGVTTRRAITQRKRGCMATTSRAAPWPLE